MGRILTLLLGLLVLLGIGYYTLYARKSAEGDSESPPERLENVKDAAKRIEADQDRRVEEALQKSGSD